MYGVKQKLMWFMELNKIVKRFMKVIQVGIHFSGLSTYYVSVNPDI